MNPILSDLLAQIADARKRATYVEIAQASGVPVHTLYKLTREKGRTNSPRLDTIEKLRAYFDRETA